MWDALTGALGKPGSPLKIVSHRNACTSSATSAGHWYWDLVHDGTKGSTYVKAIQGQLEGWDTWATIRKANPLTASIRRLPGATSGGTGRGAAGHSDSQARFLSYRLNVPSADTSEVLLTVG